MVGTRVIAGRTNGHSTPTFTLTEVRKRDGRVVYFDASKIQRALEMCMNSLGRTTKSDRALAVDLTAQVYNIVGAVAEWNTKVPTVEDVQDVVEKVLMGAGEFEAAKHYILYRDERAKAREEERAIPAAVKQCFEEAKQYFGTPIQEFQYLDKYSRWDWEQGRRETWIETVERSVDFLHELAGDRVGAGDYWRIKDAILRMQALPSMRLLAMAGEAARRQNLSIYNCSYLPVDSVEAFGEALLLSMSGVGVGFSVERKYVEQLPRVRRQGAREREPFVIEDTTEGWINAVECGISRWLDGEDVEFDFSLLRPVGAILRTKGGRSSGPEPLKAALAFARGRILARQGGILRPIDAHDIMCSIGNAAVQGGVRRTAMISLFDWDDQQLWHAKDDGFERDNSQRWNANNSVVWPSGGVTQTEFADQFLAMVRGGHGEPGIFNRQAAYQMSPQRREWRGEPGTNPCGEVNLHPWELCNLSIAVARREDTFASLRDKVEVAAIIGTIQSLATHFPGLRPQWKENCERERLLGVDVTGQLDCPAVQDAQVKEQLRRIAVETNREWAARLGINQSASVTCVKPSGNSSQLLNCSSGLHARWARYYERNVRVSATSPLFKVLRDCGVPMDPENGQTADNATTWVIHFPVKAPDEAIVREGYGAIAQCEYWLQNKIHWTEHNPSVTVTYAPDEVIDLMSWVWKHRDVIGGMAFLPKYIDDTVYGQLPYVEINEEEYERRVAAFPPIDFSLLWRHESEDMTTAAQELACLAGVCDV